MRAQLEAVPLAGDASFRMMEIDSTKGFDGHWHYHPECEITWIREGAGQRLVGDHLESFGPGDLVVLGPDLPHFWRTAPTHRGRSRAQVVQFRRETVLDHPGAERELAPVVALLQAARRGLAAVGPCDEMYGSFERLVQTPAATWRSTAAWLDLVGLLSDRLQAGSLRPLASEGFRAASQTDPRLARLFRYVFDAAESPDVTISFQRACEIAAMTPAAFSRFFKRRTGRTFSQFVNETRLARAARLLQERDDTILAIALECGFGSLSHFNRVFAAHQGCSPGTWRRRFREGGP